ncbi:MAG: hypothetical protein MUF10_17100 [Thermoanaerobaculaceae bacterium]|nr:hypothetical protein [Thermoanaerobaculaceae bacterium]
MSGFADSSSRSRWQLWLPPLVVMGALAALFAPVVGFGPVAEDFWFAVDGARVAEQPSLLLARFHIVWRPAARLPFVVWSALGASDWRLLRGLQWLGGVSLALLGWTALRRLADLPSPVAAVMAGWWLASPVGNELICGETAYLGHQVLIGCSLGAVLARRVDMTLGRRLAVWSLVIGAAAANETWIVLPLAFLLQDLLQHGLPWPVAARRSLPWLGLLAAYLVTYEAIAGFGYHAVYSGGAATVIARLALAAGVFTHLLPLAHADQVALVRSDPGTALVAVVLLGALAAGLLRTRHRPGIFLTVAAALFLLPTLPSPEQYGRWLALPWLGVLAALGSTVIRAWKAGRPWGWLARGLAVAAVGLAATDLVTTRGDVRDWQRFAQLTRRLESELPPILDGARLGEVHVILRDRDYGPLTDLLAHPEGTRKWFVPRPDEPYGITSLSAMLTWHSRGQGIRFQRLESVPPGSAVRYWTHTPSGFVPHAQLPPVVVRFPTRPWRGVPGVITRVEHWSSFNPAELFD